MRYLIAVLALAGVVVSCFALREHYRTDPSPCSINARWDCGVVNHSPFAVLSGLLQPNPVIGVAPGSGPLGRAGSIPVAVVGIAGYLAIGIFALARRWWIVLVLTTIALAFSSYLTYIEANLLETYCIWCVSSAAIITITEVSAITAVVLHKRS
jgi:vitamin-K-epoxide reductase (warfarin-sensitive)